MSSSKDTKASIDGPKDQQWDHLLLELESSDTNTVALVLRFKELFSSHFKIISIDFD